ncbi:hypothetical protein F0P96_11275 [Hymenobacter busanensis]|uniref:Uncharacterized protein n=1 Tax=Hymenobacter busanensis TaxID=2607656 RepID=A0A7L4ZWK5_9BACT|nr:hypothetical protein [Hymenobacter busanensis]KAA9332064.1 hypothetical protein F0P96_11275 [Hymenobacter busanensis]QHJ07598.1 hypothetical protein GUY19_10000 [Hymenobacter busanensis]
MHRLLRCAGVLAAALCALPAAAQETSIPNLEAWSFTGFKSVDGQFYYMLRQERNVYDLFHLELYSRDLKKLSTTDVRLGRNGKLLAARAVGDYAVFCFYNGKTGQLLKFDANGQKSQDVAVPAADVFGSITAIEPAGGGDFYVAYPIDADKKGYSVARYGADFKPKWQKDYAPEKGKYQLKMFRADATHAYAIDDYSKTGWEVACLDGTTGAEKARPALPTAPNLLEPTLASIDKAGRLLLSGTYVDKSSPRPVVSVQTEETPPREGFFTSAYSPEGKEEFLTATPYTKELGQQLNSRSSIQIFTVRNYPGLKLHELVERPGGGYTLIGETFKTYGYNDTDYQLAGGTKTAAPAAPNSSFGSMGGFGVANTRRYILDFVLMQLDAQGKITSIKRIPKPYKLYQNRSIGNGPEEFDKRLAYSYRFMYQSTPAQEPRLVFLNWHQNLQYVNTIGSTDTRDNLFTRLYLDQPVVPADKDRGELTVREFEDEVTAHNVDLFYDEVLPNVPGKFVYSHYDKARQTLFLRLLDVPGLK